MPSLAFWTGINRQRSLQSYNLQAYATPLSNGGGKPYNFVRISANEDYMDLQTGD